MKRFKFPLLLLLSTIFVRSSAGNTFVYLADTSKYFYASNNQLYSTDQKQLLYFQNGNIFFSGETDNLENIFLLTTSLDISSDNLELIYEKANRQPTYTFCKNKFYLGKTESEEFRNKNELMHVERHKKWLAFYSSLGNNPLLAYYAADSVSNCIAVIVGYLLIKKFALESKMAIKDASQYQLPFDDAPFSTIKPIYGNQTVNEWMWDGKNLRPRWNVDPHLVWTFDGQTVQPLNGNDLYGQYSWDGENFKPAWKTNRDEEWSWDGKLMKPVWSSDLSSEYTIKDGVVKPESGDTEKMWKIDGNIPIPVVILVVSGIARPF